MSNYEAHQQFQFALFGSDNEARNGQTCLTETATNMTVTNNAYEKPRIETNVVIEDQNDAAMNVPENTALDAVQREEQPMIRDLSGIKTEEEVESLSTFQRIAPGFFAQTKEPALTLNWKIVTVNAAAARLFPKVDFMEILINPDERKVAYQPCDELDVHGYKWAKEKAGKRYATQRSGLDFVLCVCQIMGWDPNKRYRILGKKVPSDTGEEILLFDLKAAQAFEKTAPGKGRSGRPTILTGWNGTFGPMYNKNEKSLHIDKFNEYMVFSEAKKVIQEKYNPGATNEIQATDEGSNDIS